MIHHAPPGTTLIVRHYRGMSSPMHHVFVKNRVQASVGMAARRKRKEDLSYPSQQQCCVHGYQTVSCWTMPLLHHCMHPLPPYYVFADPSLVGWLVGYLRPIIKQKPRVRIAQVPCEATRRNNTVNPRNRSGGQPQVRYALLYFDIEWKPLWKNVPIVLSFFSFFSGPRSTPFHALY